MFKWSELMWKLMLSQLVMHNAQLKLGFTGALIVVVLSKSPIIIIMFSCYFDILISALLYVLKTEKEFDLRKGNLPY